MKKFIITSDKLEGNICFGYNETGLLCFFEVNTTDLTDPQIKWILDRLECAYHIPNLYEWAKPNNWRVEEIPVDLGFDVFWDLYKMKRNRTDAEKIWNGFDDAKRVQVLANVKAYNRYCAKNASWYNKLYPDNYLSKHTQDEWDKL